ncbi:MAG: transporter related protein, partial [Bacteriovoracaceae bacterium]|nr:transporter related protein [Bacteriovoracaceae bacterium]
EYTGKIFLDGSEEVFDGPRDARAAGIAIIHQELSLFEELTVAENIYISDFPRVAGVLNTKSLIEKTVRLLRKFDFKISPYEKVKNLSMGEKQLVEIARSFTKPVKVLIFDEPTSALTDREIETLFKLIRELKEHGVASIYISHKIPEIRELCERITVIRDGKSVAHFDHRNWTDQVLIEAMVGRKIDSIFPPKRAFDSNRPVILKVEDLQYRDPRTQMTLLKNVSFDVREGEVFGIAGLMGSRRTELVSALFGSLPAEKISGRIFLQGKEVDIRSPQDAIRNGLALVTEDRKASGLVLEMDIKGNLTLPILKKLSTFARIRSVEESELVKYYLKLLRIKTPDEFFKVRHLSGGNQQKVIIGRWLSTQPKILLLDEPTRGIDVLAKAEIYHLIRQLVDQGLTLIIVSSELPEVVSLSDRVLVMREGNVAGILEGSAITQVGIMEKAAA